MNENEAVEIIWERHMDCEDYRFQFDRYPDGYDFEFDQAILIAAQAIEEIQQYRAIGTVEECQEAAEKQVPKKAHPLNRDSLLYKDGWRYKCPICGCAVGENVYHSDVTKDYEYCSMCGQKIDE